MHSFFLIAFYFCPYSEDNQSFRSWCSKSLLEIRTRAVEWKALMRKEGGLMAN